MDQQNLYGFLAVVFSVVLEVEVIGFIGRNKLLPSVIVRKMTHIAAGSSMLLCLPILPIGSSWSGRFAISLFLVTFIVAFSIGAYIPDKDFQQLPSAIKDRVQSLVNSCSRSGTRLELSKGTLFYCIPTCMLVCLFSTAPITVFSLSALVIGDGVADPVGRLLGGTKWLQYELTWLNNTKSYPGSIAFFLGSLSAAMAFGEYFRSAGHYDGIGFDRDLYFKAAVWSSGVATLTEAVSPPDIDNLLVPLAVMLTTSFMDQSSGAAPFLMLSKL